MTELFSAGKKSLLTMAGMFLFLSLSLAQSDGRLPFDHKWLFHLGDLQGAQAPSFDDASWRSLNLPHDWSIEGSFSPDNPAGVRGAALPGGIGWYRKSFRLPASSRNKAVFIDFDGVYCNSDVWINGHHLGFRPNGYISFRYEIGPYLHFDGSDNVIAVKVDNSHQPNSRWYSGSGIYRHVWLTVTGKTHVAYQGTYISTPLVHPDKARIHLETTVRQESFDNESAQTTVQTRILDAKGRILRTVSARLNIPSQDSVILRQDIDLPAPHLWTINDPYLYTALTRVLVKGVLQEEYQTRFGIRSFYFDPQKGFFLNGVHLKINGVCDHHDLGCLGTAVNTRAIERQLSMLKGMGVNGLRTSHNPPAPELLDLCDKMGFLVMDEAFDMWKLEKTQYDYHLYWDRWHARDLADQIRRDRNHPSVIIWSVGNEIREQWSKDSSGMKIVRELVSIVKSLDTSRPTVTANDQVTEHNQILQAGATDLVGYNYHHKAWTQQVFKTWGNKPFIVTESVSALETRGHYDMPSDSIRRWPVRWDKTFTDGNPDYTVSAYDNVSTPWGSTHEETMRVYEPNDFISGMFIWTGFDYLGEPTPYDWPARSSYFGIIDLAGFPKDVYYMYKSVWTKDPVLHIFPHWNWKAGDTVDVWAYYNNADEVELYLNGQSLGVRRKSDTSYHVMWRVPFVPGTLKAVSRLKEKKVLEREIHTAGPAARIVLQADRNKIRPDGSDLSFITVRITDAQGNLVPDADNLVHFKISGGGFIAGVDNGSETSHEPFKASYRKAFNGLCLAVLQSNGIKKPITLEATADGLAPARITINAQ